MHDAKMLSGAHDGTPQPLPRKSSRIMVSDVVLAVLGSMTGDISTRETALLYEDRSPGRGCGNRQAGDRRAEGR